MSTNKKVRVAIIGLGFGAEFIPIYQTHPNAEMYAICRRNKKELDAVGDRFGIQTRYTELRGAAERSRTSTPSTSTRRSPTTRRSASPRSRPASTSPAPCRWPPRSTSAGRSSRRSGKSGKIYMMMETVVYSREFLFVKELYDKGELGRIQFLRGSHQQDMDGWPGLLGRPAADALRHALRQPVPGDLRRASTPRASSATAPAASASELIPQVRQPVRHRDGDVQDRATRDVVAEVTRSLFDTARQYRESFDVYGVKKSFEWQQVEDEEPVIHTKSTTEQPLTERRSPSG